MRVLELLLLLVSLSLPVAAVADTGHQVFLDQLLAEVRAKDQLPAAAVMIAFLPASSPWPGVSSGATESGDAALVSDINGPLGENRARARK